MTIFAAVSLLLLAAGDAAGSSRDVGTVCVASLPARARETDHDFPGGKAARELKYRFTVQFDSLKPVVVPSEKGTQIELPLKTKHRVIIRDDGKPIESFWFAFENRGGRHLCLSYTPWYQTWSLRPRRCTC
jgi:hypothetical protein